jgi:WD40 repeat protein
MSGLPSFPRSAWERTPRRSASRPPCGRDAERPDVRSHAERGNERIAFCGAFFSCLFVFFVANAPAAEPTYWQDVRPVLRKNCTACHNTKKIKELDVSGGLALDSYQAVLQGSKQKVVQVGNSGESRLIQLLLTPDTEKRMPLAATPLPEESIALLRRWIDGGAKEGQPPDDTAAATPVTTTPRVRKRDVLLSTNAVPPAGVFGPDAPAKLELALKVGPLAPVTAVAFSPDGRLLAAGSYGQVAVWDLTTAQPVKVLTNVLAAVNDVRFSPDGSLLVVAGGQPSAKGDLRVFGVADWKLLATLGGHDDVVFSVSFSPDGKRLASASFDKTVRIWDVTTHKVERTLTGHSDFVYAVAFSPDGQWVASAGKDRSVKITEVATGKSRLTFSGMDQEVLAVAVSPDGKSVVSSGYESGLYWWNAQTGEKVRVQGGHGVAVHEITFSKDGKTVVSAGADRTVRLWDGSTGAPGKVLAVGSIVYATAIDPGGKLIVSGSFDGFVRLWNAASGQQVATLLAMPADSEQPSWLAITPEGYAAGSPELIAKGQWRMSAKAVEAAAVCKVLVNPEAVAKTVRGETVTPPAFAK